MPQHKIVKIPDWVVDDEAYLNEVGVQGWELVHVYNQHAFMKAAVGGTLASGTIDPTTDAFGRQRVSEVYTLNDYKHIYSIDNNLIDYTASNGTVTFNPNRSSVTLAVPATSGSRAVHQSKMYHNYMPGKSQLILSSFVFGPDENGIIKRTGYYDDYNGIFVEQDQTGSINFVIRSSTNGTGSILEERVKQENWNVNTLLSGDVILDHTKTQLFYTDFQWLAVGRVRCGFVYKGSTIICHTFDHSNTTDVAYMTNPNLPIRCEIINAGNPPQTGSMEQICSTVGSEGGYMESGIAQSLSNPTLRSIAGGGTLPVMAIRLKNSYSGLPNRAFVRMTSAGAFTEDQTARYELIKLPNSASLVGGSWVSVGNNSVVEYNITATSYGADSGSALFGGFIFAGGVGGGNNIAGQQQTPGVDTKVNFIAQNFDSTNSEIYALVMKNMAAAGVGNTTDVGCTLMWKEVY
jgi:hypothetical protein